MGPLPFSPFPAYYCQIKRIDLRLDLDPVFPPLSRGIRGCRNLDHNPFMPGIQGSFISPFNLQRVVADYLGSDIPFHYMLKPLPSFREREVDQGLAIKTEDIEYIGHYFDRILRSGDVMPAPEPAENRLERHGFIIFNGDDFPVDDNIMVSCGKQFFDNVRE